LREGANQHFVDPLRRRTKDRRNSPIASISSIARRLPRSDRRNAASRAPAIYAEVQERAGHDIAFGQRLDDA
jgi:hypothetical protein